MPTTNVWCRQKIPSLKLNIKLKWSRRWLTQQQKRSAPNFTQPSAETRHHWSLCVHHQNYKKNSFKDKRSGHVNHNSCHQWMPLIWPSQGRFPFCVVESKSSAFGHSLVQLQCLSYFPRIKHLQLPGRSYPCASFVLYDRMNKPCQKSPGSENAWWTSSRPEPQLVPSRPWRRLQNLFSKSFGLDTARCKNTFFSTTHLQPAVNRQPWFPRERTRREGSPCPPEGSCAISGACPSHGATLTTQFNHDYTANRRKLVNQWKLCKHSVCENSGLHARPLAWSNASKINLLEPGIVPGRPTSKWYAELTWQTQKWSGGSRDIILFRVPMLDRCPAYFGRKTADDTKTITVRRSSLRVMFTKFCIAVERFFKIRDNKDWIGFHGRPVPRASSRNSTRVSRRAGRAFVRILSRGNHGWRFTAGCQFKLVQFVENQFILQKLYI